MWVYGFYLRPANPALLFLTFSIVLCIGELEGSLSYAAPCP